MADPVRQHSDGVFGAQYLSPCELNNIALLPDTELWKLRADRITSLMRQFNGDSL